MSDNYRQHKKSLFAALITLAVSTTAWGITQADKRTEIAWAPTELSPLMLDNTVTEKYCGYNLERFLGCAAAVEQYGQFVTEKSELIYDGKQFSLKPNTAFWSLKTKDFVTQRRLNFEKLKQVYSADQVKKLSLFYQTLRQQLPQPKPYQVAVSINESLAVIYDPHRFYAPMFEYNGLNHIRQKPYMGVRTERIGDRIGLAEVVMNSSAEKAGLKAGDLILAVDGKDLKVANEEEYDQALTFEPKTEVELTIQRKDRTFKVKTVFDYAGMAKVVDRYITYKSKKYSYLHMSEVPDDLDVEPTCRIFRKNIFEKFQAQSAGLVLDFRDNLGGPGHTAACIAGLLIGAKVPVYIEVDMGDVTSDVISGDQEKVFHKPIVVLVSAKTASSGELITHALQFRSRALILGDRTYGKSIGQLTEPFKPSKIDEYSTVMKAFGPDGISYQSRGITPDLYLYREGLNPSEKEKEALREEDLALYPLKLQPVKAVSERSKPLVFPAKCVNLEKIKKQTESLADTDWQKDFQLQVALETLRCTN